MNDLDDIHRAIDDEIYARGRELSPNDGVRRAIARRRLLHRSAVAGSAALVAAAAVVAVTVVSTSGRGKPAPIAGSLTGSSSYTPLTGALSTDASPTTGDPTPSVVTSTSTPPSPLATGGGLPTGGVGHLLAAIQWHDTYGALVVVDPATGAVVHTYTSGIKDPSYDVLRYGDNAYFVATTDSRGCATGWSGIDLVTGNPVAAPAVLSAHPIRSAVIAPSGLLVTNDGGCGSPGLVQTYVVARNGDLTFARGYSMHVTARLVAVSAVGSTVAYVQDDGSLGGSLWLQIGVTFDPGFSGPIKVALPDGCTATALTFHSADLVVGATCTGADGTTRLSILQYDGVGKQTLSKDISSQFKEVAVSDVAVQGDAIYYVLNAEGVEAHTFRTTEGTTDPELAATNLFHIAAAP